MIDAIAMTEVIPFRLQENGGRAGHSLGAISLSALRQRIGAPTPQRGELLAICLLGRTAALVNDA
jgi:hypothetical protein